MFKILVLQVSSPPPTAPLTNVEVHNLYKKHEVGRKQLHVFMQKTPSVPKVLARTEAITVFLDSGRGICRMQNPFCD